MNRRKFALRFIGPLTTVIALPLILLLTCPAVAYSEEWEDQRCNELQKRLDLLEGTTLPQGGEENIRSAPLIRKEIADRETELKLLEGFQNGDKTNNLRTMMRHVPMATLVAVGGLPGMTPEVAGVLVNRAGDLQGYINQRKTRIQETELPRLQEEQTDVGSRIFLLRDESKALNCSGDAGNGQAELLDRIVGKWRASETGNVIEIAPGGDGILREVSGASASYGFSPGVTVLTNIRDVEGTLEAELTIRASKEDCPTLEPAPVRATIRFEPGNRTFILTAPSRAYCIDPCRWAAGEGDDFSRTYSRID